MIVSKTNILVRPFIEVNKVGLSINNNAIVRNVDTRLNAGTVVSVSASVKGISIGDIVGYSTYDGVCIKHNNIDYIILSLREVQSKIISENVSDVRYRDHSRSDVQTYQFNSELVKTDLLIL